MSSLEDQRSSQRLSQHMNRTIDGINFNTVDMGCDDSDAIEVATASSNMYRLARDMVPSPARQWRTVIEKEFSFSSSYYWMAPSPLKAPSNCHLYILVGARRSGNHSWIFTRRPHTTLLKLTSVGYWRERRCDLLVVYKDSFDSSVTLYLLII